MFLTKVIETRRAEPDYHRWECVKYVVVYHKVALDTAGRPVWRTYRGGQHDLPIGDINRMVAEGAAPEVVQGQRLRLPLGRRGRPRQEGQRESRRAAHWDCRPALSTGSWHCWPRTTWGSRTTSSRPGRRRR